MPLAFVQRTDTLESLTVDGLLRHSQVTPAQVTDKALEDRSYATDAVLLRPERVSLDIIATATPITPLITLTGDARINQVADFFREAQAAGAPLNLQLPSRPLLTDYAVESVSDQRADLAGAALVVTLVALRIVSSLSVQIADAPPPTPTAATVEAGVGPAGAVAAGMAPETDAGTRPTSLLVTLGQSVGLL